MGTWVQMRGSGANALTMSNEMNTLEIFMLVCSSWHTTPLAAQRQGEDSPSEGLSNILLVLAILPLTVRLGWRVLND